MYTVDMINKMHLHIYSLFNVLLVLTGCVD